MKKSKSGETRIRSRITPPRERAFSNPGGTTSSLTKLARMLGRGLLPAAKPVKPNRVRLYQHSYARQRVA